MSFPRGGSADEPQRRCISPSRSPIASLIVAFTTPVSMQVDSRDDCANFAMSRENNLPRLRSTNDKRKVALRNLEDDHCEKINYREISIDVGARNAEAEYLITFLLTIADRLYGRNGRENPRYNIDIYFYSASGSRRVMQPPIPFCIGEDLPVLSDIEIYRTDRPTFLSINGHRDRRTIGYERLTNRLTTPV